MSAVSINFQNVLRESQYFFSRGDFKTAELRLIEALVIVENERRFADDTNKTATVEAVA